MQVLISPASHDDGTYTNGMVNGGRSTMESREMGSVPPNSLYDVFNSIRLITFRSDHQSMQLQGRRMCLWLSLRI